MLRRIFCMKQSKVSSFIESKYSLENILEAGYSIDQLKLNLEKYLKSQNVEFEDNPNQISLDLYKVI